MTPRILHRIWLDEEIPEEFETYWRMFQVLHGASWDFMTWNDSSKLGWIKNREAFERASTHAGRSDVLRYELLAEIGGVYVDTDVEPLREFDPLLDERPFAGWEDHNLLCPTVMGSPPHHPAIDKLIHELPVWSRMHANSPPNRQSGPYFLTKFWRKRPDVNLLPTEVFYPVHWSKKRDLGGPYPQESYAVHHWRASWLPNGPPQR